MKDPDPTLLERCQQKDAEAFAQLVTEQQDYVYTLAKRVLRDPEDAAELTQDVFLHVWNGLPFFRGESRFRTWLYRMVTNACLSELRRPEHRVRVRSLDRSTQEHTDDPPPMAEPSTPSSEEAALDREAIERLRVAVAQLPPQQRAALLLARANGLSYEEVALSLSCSVSAVKSLIPRATETVREQLDEEGTA